MCHHITGKCFLSLSRGLRFVGWLVWFWVCFFQDCSVLEILKVTCQALKKLKQCCKFLAEERSIIAINQRIGDTEAEPEK